MIYRTSSGNKWPKRTSHFARASENTNDKISKPQNAVRDTRQRPRLLQRSLVGRERKANKVTTIKLTTQISRFTAHWLTLPHALRGRACFCHRLYINNISRLDINTHESCVTQTHIASEGRARKVLFAVVSVSRFSSPAAFVEKYSLISSNIARLSLDIPVSFVLCQ